MAERTTGEVTALLRAVDEGRRGAADELLHVVYSELHGMAERQMSKQPSAHTLQPTALVHEAYLRMFGKENAGWENSRHFYWAAARAMHDILTERARRHSTQKRGGDRRRVALDVDAVLASESDELLAISEAVKQLEVDYPEAGQVVMLRFFGGLTHEETAETLQLSSATVRRRWTFAKAWLHSRLNGEHDGS